MGKVINFAKASATTNDQVYTGTELKNEIYNIADSIGISSSIARTVVNSFAEGGLVETYDDLGTYEDWKLMVVDMLEQSFTGR